MKLGYHIRAILLRALALVVLWWALTEGERGGWWFAAPLILLAAALASLLPRGKGWRWSAAGLFRFVPFFFWQSLMGGIDVARRALHPKLPLDPALLEVPLRLADEPAQIFMAHIVSLLPGTLSADLDGRLLRVHALAGGRDRVVSDVRRVEDMVASLFALPLDGEGT